MDNTKKLLLTAAGKLPKSTYTEVMNDISSKISYATSPINELLAPMTIVCLENYVESLKKQFPEAAQHAAELKKAAGYTVVALEV